MKDPKALPVKVNARYREADDIVSYELVPAADGPLPSFTAGSHIEVRIPGGQRRCYSLCNAPSERHRYLIAVQREVHGEGGSSAMHDRVQQGDVIEISEPRNHFPLRDSAVHTVLLAAGIGITPILCMAERLQSLGASFAMHYSCKTRSRTAFYERIRSSSFASRAHFYFSDASGGRRLDLDDCLRRAPARAEIYVCGPRRFIDAALCSAARNGRTSQDVHYESFVADDRAHASDAAFEVELSRRGRVVAVPAGTTVVQALHAAGVVVPVSCRQGSCGTCLIPVLAGIPDHRDSFLTLEERAANEQFTPCCSRALTPRLVLDI
ncbi:MAG: oxidoreductase [Betaproteobacteria bacterium]|nr:oxidoreductase [Betaproteobacteria bacterium]